MNADESTFDPRCEIPDFWALSDRQLESACRMVAEGHVPVARPLLRAEAMRLFLLWRENGRRAGNVALLEERACLLAALRKRTIQVLVRMSLGGGFPSPFPG